MSEAYCAAAPGHPYHGPYHEYEYGFPARGDSVLFERLMLEVNQAGLSWLTILKKRAAFREAFAGWDIDRVAAFDESDVERLMADAGIIRNRLKIAAAIKNARILQSVRDTHGSFASWLDAHHPKDKEGWMRLFRRQFVFTGGEIVGEFLMSLGYLPEAHAETCPVYRKVARLSPPWMQVPTG